MHSLVDRFLYYFPLVLMLLITLLVVGLLVISLWPSWFSRITGSKPQAPTRPRHYHVRPPRIHRTQHRPNRKVN